MDVGVWLRSLGLGQYEEKFRDNKIDADVLPHLTADDLKGLGVITIGDRRRLLAAIAALSGATPFVDAPASAATSTSPKAPQTSAERLRSRRVDEPCSAARRRGLAQPRQHLS